MPRADGAPGSAGAAYGSAIAERSPQKKDPCADWAGADDGFLTDAANFAIGYGDSASMGLTNEIRGVMGTNDNVNFCSGAYGAGGIAGMVTPTGRVSGAVRLRAMVPDSIAKGPHTVFKRDSAGRIKDYTTYRRADPRDPASFRPSKRFNREGKPHYNKETGHYVSPPHVHGKDIPGEVRPARPNEIPK